MDRGELETKNAPWEDRTRPLRTAAWLLGALALVLGAARIYIATTAGARSSKDYDRPVSQHLFHVDRGDREFPAGFEPDPGPPVILAGPRELVGHLAPVPAPGLPEPDRIDRVQVSGYQDGLGQRRFLVAIRYRGEAAPVGATGARVVQDHHALWVLPPGSAEDPLGLAVEAKAARMKRATVQLAKVKTLGNSYVTFTMEIMIGLFFALTGMILAKLYLIQANLEKA